MIKLEELYEMKHKVITPSRQFFDEYKESHVYNSNAIEGNSISHNDVAFIIRTKSFLSKYTLRENLDILGVEKAYDYILSRPFPSLTIDTLLLLHKFVLMAEPQYAGALRTAPVYIGSKEFIDHSLVESSLIKWLQNYTPTYDIFECIAQSHLTFENIHPFFDGNGRVGRLWINLQLLREGWLPINILLRNVKLYYSSFRVYDKVKSRGVRYLRNMFMNYQYIALARALEF